MGLMCKGRDEKIVNCGVWHKAGTYDVHIITKHNSSMWLQSTCNSSDTMWARCGKGLMQRWALEDIDTKITHMMHASTTSRVDACIGRAEQVFMYDHNTSDKCAALLG